MSYDDPTLKEFAGYFKAKEPGRRERADAWATAIGLQKVDGLSTSRFLVETAKEHIEGRITQAQARRRIRDYYAAKDETPRELKALSDRVPKGGRKRWSEKGGQKTRDRLIKLLGANPHLSREGLSAALGICPSAVQKHLAKLKKDNRLRRIGPDKGGHWEVVAP